MDSKKLMIRILYLANPSSIHDQKWIRFFSEQIDTFEIFLLYEIENPIDKKTTEKLQNANIHLLDPISSFSILKPYKNLQSILRIKKIIKCYHIDLVHILFATPFALWTNFLKTPYIITTRGSDILLVLPSLLEQKGIKSLYFKWLFKQFKKAFANAKFVTSTSELQIKTVKTLFARTSVELIRTGIDIEKVTKANDVLLLDPLVQSQKFIFSPRFFSPVYNILLQIEAIALLPKSIINEYYFVFIRGLQFDKHYAQCIEQELLFLEKEIGLKYLTLDYLDQKTLWSYFNHAKLTIHTPLSDGTPNSALEAMAAKCPLLLPEINKLDGDIFEGTCVKFSKYDSKIIANHILECLNHYSEDLLEKALDRVSKFGNRKIEMNKLKKLYSHF